MVKFDESMIGKKVKFVNEEAHELEPWFYPEVGTIGEIVWVYDEIFDSYDWKVQWTSGTTGGWNGGCDCHYCGEESLELVEEGKMTNEEIWQMLEPKMKKNGLDIITLDTNIGIKTDMYDIYDVQKAIAIAYRSGFERAVKGRPFKFEDKTKKENTNAG